MHSEHLIIINDLTYEKIDQYIDKYPEIPEFTYFVSMNDSDTEKVLRAKNFKYIGIRKVDLSTVKVFKWFRDSTAGYEDMATFFDRRASDYDLHMQQDDAFQLSLRNVMSQIKETQETIHILDLGAGTGIELQFVFEKAPNANVVCIDISRAMLDRLMEKYSEKCNQIQLQCVSYLDMDFGKEQFDYVLASGTLHHILKEDKAHLYQMIYKALNPNGRLLVCDYVASDEEEVEFRNNYFTLIESGAIYRDKLYHIDLGNSYENEKELLKQAGFEIAHCNLFKESIMEIVATKHYQEELITKYSIVLVDKENYALFDDMVFYRMNGRERTPEERVKPRDFTVNYTALDDKNLRVYAAQVGDRFIGWISAVFIPKIGHPKYGGKGHLFIDELWTAPEFRRQGIAFALMNEVERVINEFNAVGLRLYVGGDNPSALALYTKCGYRDRGDDAHFMDKE